MPRNVSQAGLPRPQLLPLPIAAPGQLGLNMQNQNAILPPTWSIESQNTVIDSLGRVSARLGRTTVTASPAAGQVRSIFEYRTSTGQSTQIVGFDGGIASSVATPNTTSLVGTVSSVASGRWYFVNYMDACVGFQAGQKPIVLTSPTGTFSNIVESSGSAPQGGVGTAAYGRLWAMNADGHTLQWCALADYTDWASGDSGSIDLRHVWPLGMDQVTAITAFNGTLAIFGTRQIIFYGSTDPTVLGLDVTQLEVVDMIEGTGAIGQWTLANVGETDIVFCSAIGIQSLQRLLINRSRPTTNLTKNVRDAFIGMLAAENVNNVSGFYSPSNGFYALSMPVSGYTWIADQRHRYTDQDGDEVSRITRWNFSTTAGVEFFNRMVYLASNTAGNVQTYSAGTDDGSTFQIILQLPWLDLGQDVAARLKALKRIGGLVFARNTANVTFTWYTDFDTSATESATQTVTGGTNAEWGTAQWAIDQWSGGLLLTLLNFNGSGTGQYFSLAITTSSDSNFAVQQINLLAKLLRIA